MVLFIGLAVLLSDWGAKATRHPSLPFYIFAVVYNQSLQQNLTPNYGGPTDTEITHLTSMFPSMEREVVVGALQSTRKKNTLTRTDLSAKS